MSACLLLGVLMLETGSRLLNNCLQIATILTIVMSLWTVAIMDLPYSGAQQVRDDDLR